MECTGCGGFSEFDGDSSEGAVDGMGGDGIFGLARSLGGVFGVGRKMDLEVMHECDRLVRLWGYKIKKEARDNDHECQFSSAIITRVWYRRSDHLRQSAHRSTLEGQTRAGGDSSSRNRQRRGSGSEVWRSPQH